MAQVKTQKILKTVRKVAAGKKAPVTAHKSVADVRAAVERDLACLCEPDAGKKLRAALHASPRELAAAAAMGHDAKTK
jgi:hypothetical protein